MGARQVLQSLLVTILLSALAASAAETPVRALVSGEQVVACRLADGSEVSGDECPRGPAVAVEVIPPAAGELFVLMGPRTIAVVEDRDPEEPCGYQRTATPGTNKAQAVGRAAAQIPTSSEVYRKLVGEALGIPDVQLTHLLKIDLEGDGVDEVVYAASSHPDGVPMGGETEHYSSVGIRKVRTTDGQTQVDTVEITGHKGTADFNGGFPDITQIFIEGFADLDGDGKLEIVIRIRGYESHFIGVYRLEGKEAEMIGSTECAI